MIPVEDLSDNAVRLLEFLNREFLAKPRKSVTVTEGQVRNALGIDERATQKAVSQLISWNVVVTDGAYGRNLRLRRRLDVATERSAPREVTEPMSALLSADMEALHNQLSMIEASIKTSESRNQKSHLHTLYVRRSCIEEAIAKTQDQLINPPELRTKASGQAQVTRLERYITYWQNHRIVSLLLLIGLLLIGIAALTDSVSRIVDVGGRLLRPSRASTAHSMADRGPILIELGYSLYSFGLGADAIGEEFDSDRARQEIEEFYARLGLSIPKDDFGSERFKITRSALEFERDRHVLDVGMYLAAVHAIGVVVISHRGADYEIAGRERIQGLAHELKTALRSLGLLAAIEQERSIESYLVPTSDDTIEAYSQTLDVLKAAIVGELRLQYGT